MILPRDSHVTQLILSQAHEKACHQGRGITLNQLRSMGYWILGGSTVVSAFIRQCVRCRKLRRPTEIQRMVYLPEERVEPTALVHLSPNREGRKQSDMDYCLPVCVHVLYTLKCSMDYGVLLQYVVLSVRFDVLNISRLKFR